MCSRKQEKTTQIRNVVKEIYNPFTDDQITKEISRMLKDKDMTQMLKLFFSRLIICTRPAQIIWAIGIFLGTTPHLVVIKVVNRAFINYYEA